MTERTTLHTDKAGRQHHTAKEEYLGIKKYDGGRLGRRGRKMMGRGGSLLGAVSAIVLLLMLSIAGGVYFVLLSDDAEAVDPKSAMATPEEGKALQGASGSFILKVPETKKTGEKAGASPDISSGAGEETIVLKTHGTEMFGDDAVPDDPADNATVEQSVVAVPAGNAGAKPAAAKPVKNETKRQTPQTKTGNNTVKTTQQSQKPEVRNTAPKPSSATMNIQTGAFSQKESAVSEMKALKKKGFDAFVVPPAPGKNLHRVLVRCDTSGPDTMLDRVKRAGYGGAYITRR